MDLTVKPLIWDEHGRSYVYNVMRMYGQGPKEFGVGRGSRLIAHADTLEEGKAIAQTDHEALVRSFIEVA